MENKMNILLNDKNLLKYEKEEIKNLLARQDDTISSDLEQIWYLVDQIWDDCDCDNVSLDWEKIGNFYSHPVWLLNGLFIENHTASMEIRYAISDWITNKQFNCVVDYGGGFGTLARLIAEKNNNLRVDIYEPHPSKFGLKRTSEITNINIVNHLANNYDCLVSTDVLEHVSDPIKDFLVMTESVKIGGYLIIANCFYPVVKCHLPQNFHLRHTFDLFTNLMGLEIIGNLEGSHATIYRKVENKKIIWMQLRLIEKLSKLIFLKLKGRGVIEIKTIKQLLIETIKQSLRPIKYMFLRN